MNEAITVYLKATVLEAPLLSFTRTWQVKVTTCPNFACALQGVARVLFPDS